MSTWAAKEAGKRVKQIVRTMTPNPFRKTIKRLCGVQGPKWQTESTEEPEDGSASGQREKDWGLSVVNGLHSEALDFVAKAKYK